MGDWLVLEIKKKFDSSQLCYKHIIKNLIEKVDRVLSKALTFPSISFLSSTKCKFSS